MRDPRLGMVTLTEVRVSNDLSYATVYYSVLGARAAAGAGNSRRGGGRCCAARSAARSALRHSPELRFVQDELIESGARLSALINKAVKDDVARHVDEPTRSGRCRKRRR